MEECPSVQTVDPEITRWLSVSYRDRTYQMKVLGTTSHYPFADDMPVENLAEAGERQAKPQNVSRETQAAAQPE